MLPLALTPSLTSAPVFPKELLEHVDRRRRQIEIHSIIYYKMLTSVVKDSLFDHWCQDLVYLQKTHPGLKEVGYKHKQFADFTGETGMHLTTDPTRFSLAEWLVVEHVRKATT